MKKNFTSYRILDKSKGIKIWFFPIQEFHFHVRDNNATRLLPMMRATYYGSTQTTIGRRLSRLNELWLASLDEEKKR